MFRHLVLALLSLTFSHASQACSPPSPRDDAGFVRHHVAHLPKNALGVMFVPLKGKLRPDDFQVVSSEDRRRLRLRVRTFEGMAWVRLEPEGGFQPGASYTFRYLRPHGNWTYPDRMNVRIDDAAVSTAGQYAIVLAPRPLHRVIVAPTSAGSCVASFLAVVQEFTYTVPPALAAYRDALVFATHRTIAGPRLPFEGIGHFPHMRPTLYHSDGFSLGEGRSQRYTASRNAVVAPCDKRWPRIRLESIASFPEVDTRRYPMKAVEFDLTNNVEGRCSPLDALVQSVDWRAPEPDLIEFCASVDKTPPHRVDLDEWERKLGFFYDMSPTCNLVTLAYLWRTEQFSTSSAAMRRLGTALKDGLASGEPPTREAAIHALAYLVEQLPPASRRRMARELLSPAQSWLVDQLAAAHPPRPDDTARLIIASGSLAPALRARVQAIANGRTDAAGAARAVLARERDDPRAR